MLDESAMTKSDITRDIEKQSEKGSGLLKPHNKWEWIDEGDDSEQANGELSNSLSVPGNHDFPKTNSF